MSAQRTAALALLFCVNDPFCIDDSETDVISEPLCMTVVSWRAQSGAEREPMMGFRGVGIQGLISWSESQEAKLPEDGSFF